MLQLQIGNVNTDIVGTITSTQWRELEKKLSFRPKNFMFTRQYNKWTYSNGKKRRIWDGWTRLCRRNKKRTYFPTGLYSIVIDYLKEAGLPYKTVDCRIIPEPNIKLELSSAFEKRDYQTKVCDPAIRQQRGIIQAATGSGKTSMAANIICELSVAPFLFFVTSIDLLIQARDELQKFLTHNGSNLRVGQIGGGVIDIADINVLTVQTAVRAIGKKWQKYDSDDKDDLTPIAERAEDIKELLASAKGAICDEVQHWRADMCQEIAKAMHDCYYIYGMSATPYRDEGDDLIIQSCFGKKVAVITASELIQRNWLMKPNIYIVHLDNKRSLYKQWQSIYKEQVVESSFYNSAIANIANAYIQKGRLVLVLVQQINHGKYLESMIDGSRFISGQSSKKVRIDSIEALRNKEIRCIIASSLPYSEMILVRHNNWVQQMEIGYLCHFCEKEVESGEYETLCSMDGKTYTWKRITKTHIHKLENNVVRVETDRGEDVYVTENHSLVDYNLKQVKPQVGALACVPQGIPKNNVHLEINLVELFSNIDDDSLEIEVLGLSQPLIRKLKSEYKYLCDKNSVSKSTRIRIKKQLVKEDSKQYKLALFELFEHFRYYKFRYRAKLSDVKHCSAIFNEFECRIFIRRSRKDFSLPIMLPITTDLAVVSGLMCGDGHIKHHTRGKTCKSIYAFDFAAKINNTIDGRNDVDKRNIRNIFKRSFRSAFGDSVTFSENDRLIKYRGKLIYYLFWKLGHINNLGEKRVPDYVYNSSKEIQEHFLWGLYLSDGSKKIDYKSKKRTWGAICIHNSSRPLIIGVQVILQVLGKKYYCRTFATDYKRQYVITIRDSILHLKPQIKRDKLNFHTSNRTQTKIELAHDNSGGEGKSGISLVYDISVEDSHNFLGGSVLCHNTIFDEGIDVKPLDTLLLAGQGKSRTRAMQRVGRTLRPFEGKPNPTVIDFRLNQKYLVDHCDERIKMYETESEFNIKHLDTSKKI